MKYKVRCINNKVQLQHYLKHYSFRPLHSINVSDPYPSVPTAMTSSAMSQPMTTSDEFNTHKRTHWAPMLQVGFGVKNDQHLSWGVYGVYSSIKIALCVLQRALILSWSAPLNHKRPAGTWSHRCPDDMTSAGMSCQHDMSGANEHSSWTTEKLKCLCRGAAELMIWNRQLMLSGSHAVT